MGFGEGNKLGPSGKPQVNKTYSNIRESTHNKALKEESGAVDHHNPKDGQRPHMHATNRSGKKRPNSTHHEYPE